MSMQTKEITLTQGMTALVDAGDYNKLNKHKWYAYKGYKSYYAGRSVKKNGKVVQHKMHREILEAPKGYDCDHIDHNGLNNTRANLRLATRSENSFNRPINENNKSGYRCIRWYKQTNRWVLQMKGTTVGYFQNLDEAVAQYNLKAKEHWGEFAPQQKVPTREAAEAYKAKLLSDNQQ